MDHPAGTRWHLLVCRPGTRWEVVEAYTEEDVEDPRVILTLAAVNRADELAPEGTRVVATVVRSFRASDRPSPPSSSPPGQGEGEPPAPGGGQRRLRPTEAPHIAAARAQRQRRQ